ncbi:MAG: N-acetylmuramoyl-L-alanine amidase [Bacteroidia bacterium]|nr:N-acetylmuramoyl-L-alanine amidase [Bacteroidia bacterium]
MIYLIAGHNPKGPNPDPGAVANGYKEADLTVELRDMIARQLNLLNYPIWIDDDTKRLPEVLKEIDSSETCIVCDLHFNSGPPKASGVEVFVPTRSTHKERVLASAICSRISGITMLPSRGVRSEDQSARGRIGILHEPGTNLLIEVCFISNKDDMAKYQKSKKEIAIELALLLAEASNGNDPY